MIPSQYTNQRNLSPRLIKCSEQADSTPSLIDLLQVQSPSLSLTHNLVDYRSFPAPEKETSSCSWLEPSESTHEKRRTLLRERKEQTSCQQEQSKQSVRRSMVDLIPPTRAQLCDSDDDESDEESEVMFALKVSRPARLIPRPTNRTRRGSVEHWGNGSIAALSLLDESMTLQSTHRLSSHNLAKLAKRQTVGDFSQSCAPNHDSFQTNANFSAALTEAPAAPPSVASSSTYKPDPRKQRKSMMNWLANRQPSRHLLDPPSKDPKPPTFVKVIYLPEEQEEDLQMEDPMDNHNSNKSPDDQEINTKPEHDMGSMPAIQHYLELMENSYQRKVASSMAA